jgi:hypothetical protein
MAMYGSNQPLLDARLEGKLFSAPANTKTKLYYTFSHEQALDNVKFIGVSLYAWASNVGDNVTLWTEYYVPQLNVWKRYKKFGKTFMIFPDTEMKNILFPTTPSNGVRVVVEYDNKGNTAIDFAINFYNFVDQTSVSPSNLEEGEDW